MISSWKLNVPLLENSLIFFFRFDTSYQGDIKVFSESLWEEYISWFGEKVSEEYDIMAALKKDGRLYQDYHPDGSLERTAENLWSELLRFKSCIKGLEHVISAFISPLFLMKAWI